MSLPPPHQQQRWTSLADRLNPNRAAFDPQLKASWKTMSKSERKRIIAEDRKVIQSLKSRGTSQGPLPFVADPDDHCETSPVAHAHIAPLLNFIAKQLGKAPCDLQIYDPYYCAGGTVYHLNKLGFGNVYNKCEDFYNVIAEGRVPSHDVILTNPPYSGDHFDKLLQFLSTNNKPALLLLPEHFSKNKSSLYLPTKFCFMTPPERYHYWTPEGMRPDHYEKEKKKQEKKGKKRKKQNQQHKNLVLGSRNSPFASHWFICMEPIMRNASFVSLATNMEGEDGIQLVDGCCIHEREEDVKPTTFKGTAVRIGNDEDSSENIGEKDKRKKKRRRKDMKKKAEESA